MTLAAVTSEGVLAAIAEFDRLGRTQFCRSRFGRGQGYYLDRDGQLYDAMPIVSYAHGFTTGISLNREDLRGQGKAVAQRLQSLGFTVRHLPDLDWTRDEITLACALVEANGWEPLDARDRRVQELSDMLQSPAIHPLTQRYPDFRNPAGVARKTLNIASVHPDYRGTPTHGNRLDKEVLEDFMANPSQMRDMAARIRELLMGSEAKRHGMPDLDTDDGASGEGGLALRAHLRRERDPKLRRKKISDTKRRGLPIACEVCDFDFGLVYGARGLDYIECHHRTPLHVTGETTTRLIDLALLCSNCHRMIHRTNEWMTVEALKETVTERRQFKNATLVSLARK